MCSCPSPSSLAVLSRFLSAGGKKALQKRSSRARAGCGSRSARRSSSGARPARSLRRRRLVQRPAHSGASQPGGRSRPRAASGPAQRPRPTRGRAGQIGASCMPRAWLKPAGRGTKVSRPRQGTSCCTRPEWSTPTGAAGHLLVNFVALCYSLLS